MTPEERAEKIVFSIFHEPEMDHPQYEKLIAAQIREAVEEAFVKESDRKASCVCGPASGPCALHKDCYRRWQAEAYEDAAKIAEQPLDQTDTGPCYACDCHRKVPQEIIPKKIR